MVFVMEREFWSLVKIGLPNDCWAWLGKKQFGRGYGRFRSYAAHRFAFESRFGIKPGEFCICHSCDNPSCVNPKHLFLATQAENLRDMWAKSRGKNNTRRGESCNKAKLTADQAIAVFKSIKSTRSIAKEFGISRTAVQYIKTRKNWAHVTKNL